ncbi:MAG: protein kinase, partial [Candidatus Hydrogenedentes bacterium]|nr:protein kinase [Candidatus Hydrogenedentota bacterium]
MRLLDYYWNILLQWVVDWFTYFTDVEVTGVALLLTKIVLTLIVLYAILGAFKWIRKLVRSGFRGGLSADGLIDMADIRALKAHQDGESKAVPVQQPKEVEAAVAQLKKGRDYDGMAELYASAGRHKEAAKYYAKAGRRRNAAIELGKAGKPLKAARILLKEADFADAAQYFSEAGRHLDAAKAYVRADKSALAAASFAQAQDFAKAASIYTVYFTNPPDTTEAQVAAADRCYAMLNSEMGRARISADQRRALLPHVAARFEKAERFDLAAALFKESGDLVRAGEVYLLAGKLEEAAHCMKQAGKDKEAARIAGRYQQSKGNWREAAAAFAQAGDYLSAGEMFAKASDAVRAGECFERSGEFYRAGVAYAHAARYEQAIRVLQKVTDKHAQFDVSRAMLGRCFYELHDYAHCAAALDNHLTGKRVDTQNIEYFYMLALAFEQLGKLDNSREILYKIRTVNVGFRDVADRISSISSRISMAASATPLTPAPGSSTGAAGATHAGSDAPTQVMQSVESSLGGRYVLEKELGRGGMGVVYLARDSQLERPVALKFLGSLVDSSEEFRERFVREARTAARISHPNIISIYDISASVGKAYIAMEYVDGPSLHKLLGQRGKMKPREAVNVVVQACGALAAIHDEGIIHRDIKPDNILIAKGGLVKLTDFGLAKAEDSRMTRTGVVMGTPSYMSPEQVLGKDADARSD